jgi:hypothetical protein
VPNGAANPGEDTFPYDGGPEDPVPMPKTEPAPTSKPPARGKAEGQVVSLRAAKPSKYRYPAYGERPGRTSFADDRTTTVVKKPTSFAEDRTVPVKGQTVRKTRR